MLSFNDFVEAIPEVDSDTRYFFIRTDHGDHFESFLEKGFVGIGWNAVTIDNLVNLDDVALRGKVEQVINTEGKSPKMVKTSVTKVIRKLKLFHSMKMGDIVVAPSRNSKQFAFGRISDHSTYSFVGQDSCPHYKRRKVTWLKTASKNSLPPPFRFVRAQQAITELDSISDRIDSVLNGVYTKDEYTYLRIRVMTDDPIPLSEISRAFQAIEGMSEILKQIDPDFDEPTIKINLNSKGEYGVKFKSGVAGAILAFAIFTSCNPEAENLSPEEIVEKIPDIENLDSQTLAERIAQLEASNDSILQTIE